jgi:hypothetical protein
MRRTSIIVVFALGLAALAVEPVRAQCPMCRLALQSPEGQLMAAALRRGILLLLAAPFVVFATVAMLAARRFLR